MTDETTIDEQLCSGPPRALMREREAIRLPLAFQLFVPSDLPGTMCSYRGGRTTCTTKPGCSRVDVGTRGVSVRREYQVGGGLDPRPALSGKLDVSDWRRARALASPFSHSDLLDFDACATP